VRLTLCVCTCGTYRSLKNVRRLLGILALPAQQDQGRGKSLPRIRLDLTRIRPGAYSS
jgi:hypothetical protein